MCCAQLVVAGRPPWSAAVCSPNALVNAPELRTILALAAAVATCLTVVLPALTWTIWLPVPVGLVVAGRAEVVDELVACRSTTSWSRPASSASETTSVMPRRIHTLRERR